MCQTFVDLPFRLCLHLPDSSCCDFSCFRLCHRGMFGLRVAKKLWKYFREKRRSEMNRRSDKIVVRCSQHVKLAMNVLSIISFVLLATRNKKIICGSLRTYLDKHHSNESRKRRWLTISVEIGFHMFTCALQQSRRFAHLTENLLHQHVQKIFEIPLRNFPFFLVALQE